MAAYKIVYTHNLRGPGLEADWKAPDHQVTVSGATALLKLGWEKAITDRREEVAPGALSLCVCEAFTNTLAVNC